jgi:amidophosphoribosyltransferase
MGGFFGVVSKEDCVDDLFYGTDYHSHLGTRRGGIATTNSQGEIIRRIHDISNAQFRSKFSDDIDDFSGNIGIGIISDYEDQPLLISSHLGTYCIVTVGKINNCDELVTEAFERGISHFSEMSDGEMNQTEIVAMLINSQPTIEKGIALAQEKIEGSCSLLVMLDHCLYAARDALGRTPVIVGEKDGAFAVTMETTAFPNLDYTVKHELGPGEIVKINSKQVIQKKAAGDRMQICSFLWVYYGYPSSSYEGINTEDVRYRNGQYMANTDAETGDLDIDLVCGIPDSGVGHALGYANAAGVPYRRAFVKYTPTWPRSFMPQNQNKRNLVARMKLIPVQELIKDKSLLFCDDSIVRGTQLQDTVVRLFERGAKEVHMRSSCPPLAFGCKFLNFSRSRSVLDLVARRAIEEIEGGSVSDKVCKEYTVTDSEKYNKMLEVIRKKLKLGTLKYQKLEKLVEAIGLPKERLCTYCWDGQE